MITQAKDYYDFLYRIQDVNAPSLATLLPKEENIYEVDLESRKVEAPEFISVTSDHMSETIYFKCPRFYENVDLATTVGVIEYINANGDPYIYAIPYYDVETFSRYDKSTLEEENYILFPWVVDGAATAAAGPLTFALRFYKLTPGGDFIQYNLNTLPSTTTVQQGLNSNLNYEEYNDSLATYAEKALAYVKQASDIGVFWTDL